MRSERFVRIRYTKTGALAMVRKKGLNCLGGKEVHYYESYSGAGILACVTC